MAINLKTINSSIQEGNEDTKRLSNNFEKWFELQRKSRLDLLEDRREKRKKMAGATGGGHQKFKNRNGMGAGLLGLGALAMMGNNTNTGGGSDGGADDPAGGGDEPGLLKNIMSSPFVKGSMLAAGFVLTAKGYKMATNSKIKPQPLPNLKNPKIVNNAGAKTPFARQPLFGQRPPRNTINMSNWKAGVTQTGAGGVKFQFNAAGTHFFKLDAKGLPVGQKIRFSSPKGQALFHGNALNTGNPTMNRYTTVPQTNRTINPKANPVKIPVTVRNQNLLKTSTRVGGGLGGGVMNKAGRFISHPFILATTAFFSNSMGGVSDLESLPREITSDFMKVLQKGSKLKVAKQAAVKFLAEMKDGGYGLGFEFADLLFDNLKPMFPIKKAQQEQAFIDLYSFLYAELNTGRKLIFDEFGDSKTVTTPFKILTGTMLSSGEHSTMSRDIKTNMLGILGKAKFDTYFKNNMITPYLKTYSELGLSNRFTKALGFDNVIAGSIFQDNPYLQPGYEISATDAMRFGPDLSKVQLNAIKLREDAAANSTNSSAVNIPIIDQSSVTNGGDQINLTPPASIIITVDPDNRP